MPTTTLGFTPDATELLLRAENLDSWDKVCQKAVKLFEADIFPQWAKVFYALDDEPSANQLKEVIDTINKYALGADTEERTIYAVTAYLRKDTLSTELYGMLVNTWEQATLAADVLRAANSTLALRTFEALSQKWQGTLPELAKASVDIAAV